MSAVELSENQLKQYYEDADRYLLKSWRTRTSDKEPIVPGGRGQVP